MEPKLSGKKILIRALAQLRKENYSDKSQRELLHQLFSRKNEENLENLVRGVMRAAERIYNPYKYWPEDYANFCICQLGINEIEDMLSQEYPGYAIFNSEAYEGEYIIATRDGLEMYRRSYDHLKVSQDYADIYQIEYGSSPN